MAKHYKIRDWVGKQTRIAIHVYKTCQVPVGLCSDHQRFGTYVQSGFALLSTKKKRRIGVSSPKGLRKKQHKYANSAKNPLRSPVFNSRDPTLIFGGICVLLLFLRTLLKILKNKARVVRELFIVLWR